MVAAHIVKELQSTKERHNGAGMYCNFYRLHETFGIKAYIDRTQAIKTYNMQRMFHKLGLGAKCWGYSEYESGQWTIYAYFTECVDVWCDLHSHVVSNSSPKLNVPLTEYMQFLANNISKSVSEKTDKAITSGDLHSGNIGIYKREHCIVDFSHFNINYGHKDYKKLERKLNRRPRCHQYR